MHEKQTNRQDLIQDKSKCMKNDTLCTQAPLGFLPLGCLNKNGHVTHAKYRGKTKQNKIIVPR